MTGQESAEQIRRRRERDRINHARARARDRGEDPGKIGGPEPAVRRVALPVSRAPQTGWQDRAACRTSPPQWFDAETDANAAKALRVCAGCPVRRDCFGAAAADRAESGVWGGVDLSAAARTAGKAAAS
jgi:WhiB family redox-sensing transcriptional regulator